MSYYYERLPGWSEFTGLYRDWVRDARDGARMVEVGIWRGRSTIAMAEFIHESGKPIDFWAVDHFKGSDEHQAELAETGDDLRALFEHHAQAAGVRHLINLLVMDSVEAGPLFDCAELDLVYLDASHDFESVSRDIQAWWPTLRRGGILAGHDWSANWPEVVRAVRHFARVKGLSITELGTSWRIDKPC